MSDVRHHDHRDWRCAVGRHHYVTVQDDNPEMRGESHRACTRCGHVKEFAEYGAPPPGGLAGGLYRARPDE